MSAELGKLLESIRISKKMSLREVSERSGVSHAYIRDMELARNRSTNKPIKPSPEILEKLSEVYNYSYDELMHVAGYVKEAPPVTRFIDHVLPNTDKLLFFKIDNDRIEMAFIDEVQIQAKITASEIVDLMEKLDLNAWKKVDGDVYFNFNYLKGYDENKGLLISENGFNIEIAKARQIKLKNFILTKLAKNNGLQSEFNVQGSFKGQFKSLFGIRG